MEIKEENSKQHINKRNRMKFTLLKSKPFLMLIFTIIILSLGFFTLHSVKQKKVATSSMVQEKLMKIQELATAKYSYTKILEVKNDKVVSGFTLPFTQKYFLLQFDGYMKVGVDLSKAKIKVDDDKKSITVEIPKSKVLDHVINQESIKIYDEKSGLFNKLQLQDMIDEITSQKKNVEEEMLKKGLLSDSDKNAKVLLEELLKSMGYESVTVTIE